MLKSECVTVCEYSLCEEKERWKCSIICMYQEALRPLTSWMTDIFTGGWIHLFYHTLQIKTTRRFFSYSRSQKYGCRAGSDSSDFPSDPRTYFENLPIILFLILINIFIFNLSVSVVIHFLQGRKMFISSNFWSSKYLFHSFWTKFFPKCDPAKYLKHIIPSCGHKFAHSCLRATIIVNRIYNNKG
jgi:hypothetical protein